MSLQITHLCVSCHACLHVCPEQAVVLRANTRLEIRSARCTECAGDFDEPICGNICPVEGALVDGEGTPLHLPGSLSGVLLANGGYRLAGNVL